MKRLFLILTVFATLITPTIIVKAIAEESRAEADVEKRVELKSDIKQVIFWMENNQSAIRDVLKVTILEELGKGRFKVKHTSSKGEFVWIMQETITKSPDGRKYFYKSKLIKSISGGITHSETEISVATFGKKTAVVIHMMAGVNHPGIRNGNMTIDFVNHTSRFKRLLESKLD